MAAPSSPSTTSATSRYPSATRARPRPHPSFAVQRDGLVAYGVQHGLTLSGCHRQLVHVDHLRLEPVAGPTQDPLRLRLEPPAEFEPRLMRHLGESPRGAASVTNKGLSRRGAGVCARRRTECPSLRAAKSQVVPYLPTYLPTAPSANATSPRGTNPSVQTPVDALARSDLPSATAHPASIAESRHPGQAAPRALRS